MLIKKNPVIELARRGPLPKVYVGLKLEISR